MLRQQIEHLIEEPLRQCGPTAQPLVIIVDALDECFPETGAEEILILWAAKIRTIKKNVKLLITSRPELHIRSKFQSPTLRFISQSYILHDIEKSIVRADIELFLRFRLDEVASQHGLKTPWPTPYELGVLVKRADVLFIYAATAIKFIADKHWADPNRQLRVLLVEEQPNSLTASPVSRYREVDSLYLQVLQNAIPEELDDGLSSRFRTVVGAIVLLQDPMTSGSLELLLQLEHGTVRRCLSRLHSVILVPDSEESPIRIFHPSFLDFLTSRQRCLHDRFFISGPRDHSRLAIRCLETMLNLLKRDICGVGDPWRMNQDIDNLEQRLVVAVPSHLRYSCLYFASHVSAAFSEDEKLVMLVETFCRSKLLAWFEVLSLLGMFYEAVTCLRLIRHWYTVSVHIICIAILLAGPHFYYLYSNIVHLLSYRNSYMMAFVLLSNFLDLSIRVPATSMSPHFSTHRLAF